MASGASAGAMNAAMLVQGLATGGPAEAKRLLEAFWRRVAVAAGSPDAAWGEWFSPIGGLLAAPVADALRQAANGLSRTQVNPLGLNPLRGVLDGLLDPSAFGKPGAPALVASATRVRTRSIALAQRCLADLPPALPGALARLRDARLHAIGAEEEFRALKAGSRRDPTWGFLRSMWALGRRAAERWLGEHLTDVGVRSTVDLATFAGPVLDPGLGARRSAAA